MIKMKEISQDGTKRNIIRIIKGTGIATGLTLIGLLVYSALLTYTNLNENTIPVIIIIITSFSILIGSFISSTNIKKNGLTNGALVGMIYIFIIYFISSIISGNFSFNILSIIMIIVSIMTGAVGGIIGVNIGSQNS